MVMLLVASLGSLAVIGVVGYVTGRRTLMPIASERMTQLRAGQKRAIENAVCRLVELAGDLQSRIHRG